MLHPGALREVSKQPIRTRTGLMFQSLDSSFKVVAVRASSSKFETPPKLLISMQLMSSSLKGTNARSLSLVSKRYVNRFEIISSGPGMGDTCFSPGSLWMPWATE